MLKSRTIGELVQELKCDEGYVYAMLTQLKISRKSDYVFTEHDLEQIALLHENQSKSAPKLAASPHHKLAEQTPLPVRENRPKPILRLQNQYSGAAAAELESRKQVFSNRLETVRDEKFQEGALEELAGEYARIDGILAVRSAILGKQQAQQQEYESYSTNLIEGGDFLDGSAQKAYSEMPVAPERTQQKEARKAIDAIANWSNN